MTSPISRSATTFLWASALAGALTVPHIACAQNQTAPAAPRMTAATAPPNPNLVPIVANVERDFATPPATARPWVYWFVMDGNFTKRGITADLEAMKRAGIGGLIFMEVNVGIPKGPVKFMSPEWQGLWAHAVRESERLGIALTLNGGPGWTGSGGPWVKAPLSIQLLTSASLDVTGPQTFNGEVPRPANRSNLTDYYKDVRVLAFPKPSGDARIAAINQKAFIDRASFVSGGASADLPSHSSYPKLPANEVVDGSKIIDLTDKMGADGRLNWEVPTGEWTIMRFGATNNGHSTLPAPESGLGMESDKFSKAGLNAHYRDFIGPLLKTVGPRVVAPDRGWNNLHIDSWEVGTQNWTPAFIAEFKARRGYDPLPYFPTISGTIVNSLEQSERFLWDWRETANDLVVQNHVAHFKNIAAKDGFGLSIEAYDKVMASDISLGAPADVPMGEFWGYDPPRQTTFSLPEASSIAHTNGKKIVGAESYTSGGSDRWLAYPGNMKELGDWAFTQGVNRFVFHRYQHQPDLDKFPGMTMGGFGIHFERTQTWWDLMPAYTQYLSRSQYLLRQGLSVSDVAFLVAEGAPQTFLAPESATKGPRADRLGYTFDAITSENVIANMTFKNGQLTLPDGTSYRVLVLPQRDTMTLPTLRKISQLVNQGATVIGPRPLKSPSLSGFPQNDAEIQRIGAQLWGKIDGVKNTENRVGKGRIIYKSEPNQDLSSASRSPLSAGKWIWYAEGSPASSAPPGDRYFYRTVAVDNVANLQSASVSMTADNSFNLSINGTGAAQGDQWQQIYTFDIVKNLKSGDNQFAVAANNATNSPSPAGLIGVVRLQYKDGRVVEIPTDSQWTTSQTSAQQAATGNKAAQELGALTIGPWNLSATVPTPQYGDYAVVTNALKGMNVPMDFQSDGPIRNIHRRSADGDYYFVANSQDHLVEATCTFRATSGVPELWNPLTGERRALPQFTARNGVTSVPMRFEPNQSWFVVFRSAKSAIPKAATRAATNFPAMRSVMDVTGPWQVSFDPKWGGPAQTTFPTLTDWSKNEQDGIRYYSGKAVYNKTFTAPQTRAGSPVYLDLGVVNDMANIKLNGRDMGTVWCAPWSVDISSALKPGANQLEITVANRWPNRLIGDKNLPADKRFTSTTWDPYKAGDPLLPSGLLGPVQIMETAAR